MGHLFNGLRGSWVSCLIGHMGHGSVVCWVTWVMGQSSIGSYGSWVSWLIGHMGHGSVKR